MHEPGRQGDSQSQVIHGDLESFRSVTITLVGFRIMIILVYLGDGPLRYWCSFPAKNPIFDDKKKKSFFPADQAEALVMIEAMYASCLQCVAGDNTLSALELSMKRLLIDDENNSDSLDESFVIVTSDALLGQYGIKAGEIAQVMKTTSTTTSSSSFKTGKVKPIMIFMGSIRDEAEDLKRQLPADSCYLCLGQQGQELAIIIKTILSRTLNSNNKDEF